MILYISKKVGILSWFATCLYFLVEPFFILTSTAPYSFLNHAMSDLGVTSCGTYTYSIAPHEICSPHHFWMNVLFIINGLTLSIGVLYISQNLKKTKITQLATAFILILALGNIVSGFIPADINLFWHSIFAQLGMINVLAGLWIYASSLNRGKYWTYGCLVSLLVILILIMLVFFVPMPTGLLQRLFYLVIFIWGTVLSFMLNK
ncbi:MULTISPECIES: DUF998 domain-containing protein [Priestia]|uniref:DUF998 domain-containing protein n=1 Tax=Priestia TaxID=2800373 RepID=UPI0005EC661D|nr:MULTISPECIES: DUF998 domain-containing protein [Priestia]KJL05493.1 hypothetical protein N178_06300 [Priestia aryabhattai B8W22]MBX4163650.1 DUF998 domain-containing protein [Priestia megaterium]